MLGFLCCWIFAMEVSENTSSRQYTGQLLDPRGRMARIDEKRNSLLRFLRKNYYTSADIAGLVIGVKSRQGVHTTLTAMERDGLIRRETVEAHGRSWTLWGITSHGQAMAFDPDKGEQPDHKYFETGRVGLTVLGHTLDLQRLCILAENNNWTGWQYGDRMSKWQANSSRPDALVTSSNGVRYALECERTIKTVKRYESIISDRLQAIKRGDFERCLWLCPTRDQSRRLQAIFRNIKEVSVAGTRVKLQDRHHASLMFTSFEDFPNNIGE